MIINRIYEHQNLLSLQHVSFLVGLRTYQHPYIYIYINSTNMPPIMIINRIYEHQNLLSLQHVSFLVGLKTYQHPCITYVNSSNIRFYRGEITSRTPWHILISCYYLKITQAISCRDVLNSYTYDIILNYIMT